jgi:hypothetical protein
MRFKLLMYPTPYPKKAYQTFMKILLELIDYLPDNLYEFCVASSREKLSYLKHKPTALVLAFLDYVYLLELLTGCKEKKPKWKSIYEVDRMMTDSTTPSQFVMTSSNSMFR